MAKAEVTAAVKQLRDAVRAQDSAARAIVGLVKLLLDDAKESLVVTTGDDTLRAQGAALAFRSLYKDLTTDPPSITPGADKK